MKKRVNVVLASSSAALFAACATMNSTEQNDWASADAAIEAYFKGHATGDPAYCRAAFLPTAHIEGNRGGQFSSWTLAEYCATFRGEPAADEASRRRSIDSIEVSGDAAMARATLVHRPTTFTDFFVLLKVDGEWKIANKVYYAKRD